MNHLTFYLDIIFQDQFEWNSRTEFNSIMLMANKYASRYFNVIQTDLNWEWNRLWACHPSFLSHSEFNSPSLSLQW